MPASTGMSPDGCKGPALSATGPWRPQCSQGEMSKKLKRERLVIDVPSGCWWRGVLSSPLSYRGCPSLGTAGHSTAAPCSSWPPALVKKRKKKPKTPRLEADLQGWIPRGRHCRTANQPTNAPGARAAADTSSFSPVPVQPESNLTPSLHGMGWGKRLLNPR